MTCCVLFAAALGGFAWAARRLTGTPAANPLAWRLQRSSPADD